MMKITGKAFAKKLFGAKYERLSRTLLIDVIIFWGLYIAGFQVQIAASVRILMISAFTAGVMWQALSSKDNAVELKHMLMLPQQPQEIVFSYVAAPGGLYGSYKDRAASGGSAGCVCMEAHRDDRNGHQYASCGPCGCRSLLSKKILVCGRHLGNCHSVRHSVFRKQIMVWIAAACE